MDEIPAGLFSFPHSNTIVKGCQSLVHHRLTGNRAQIAPGQLHFYRSRVYWGHRYLIACPVILSKIRSASVLLLCECEFDGCPRCPLGADKVKCVERRGHRCVESQSHLVDAVPSPLPDGEFPAGDALGDFESEAIGSVDEVSAGLVGEVHVVHFGEIYDVDEKLHGTPRIIGNKKRQPPPLAMGSCLFGVIRFALQCRYEYAII